MNKKIIRRCFAALLTVLIFTGSVITTFAAESEQTTIQETRGYGSAEFPSQRSILISGSATKVSYTAVCTGKPGAVILRFRNRTTGEVRTHTFTCDNVYHSNSKLGINPFSEGWWDIEYVMSTCDNFITIFMNFS